MATKAEREFYEKALGTGKHPWQKAGYVQQSSQRERFLEFLNVLRRSGTFDKYSLLDVGCGTGDLLPFLNGVGFGPKSYDGIDVNEDMVTAATAALKTAPVSQPWRVTWGDLANVATQLALTRGRMDARFDVTACISAYAFKHPEEGMEDGLQYVQHRIGEMVRITERLVFVTLFSPWAAQLHPLGECMYVDPMVMWSWARTRWPRVDLIHSYAPHDYALAIFLQEGEWWREWREAH